MAFTLKDATLPQDFQRVGELIVDGWEDDNFWRAVQHEATDEDAVAWWRDLFAALFSKPYHHFYVIVDEENSKIVAFTGLQVPAHISEQDKADAMKVPELPKGMRVELIPTLFDMLGAGTRNGYDPETDFHRRGTFVDPEYQKKGLGTRLTKHCNDISDRAGARTVVPAAKNSIHMFKSNGFAVKEEMHVDLKPYTGRKGLEDFWLLIREPHPPSSSK